jgi:hypothetical protein
MPPQQNLRVGSNFNYSPLRPWKLRRRPFRTRAGSYEIKLTSTDITWSYRPLKQGSATGTQIGSGLNFPAVKLVEIFSPDDWEGFTEEYVASVVPPYTKTVRFTGPGDMGRDIVGFRSGEYFQGLWDNYQCKRYGEKLVASDIWIEVGKLIYHAFCNEFQPPQNYYFAGSKDIGLNLKKLLTDPAKLKSQLFENWDKYCKSQITSTKQITLTGALKIYFDAFDFSIFKPLSVVEMIAVHSKTSFYVGRFGSSHIPIRPKPDLPPNDVQPTESRYVQQLLKAYADHLKVSIHDVKALAKWPEIEEHFNRAREVFYHAESLRNFARDSVDVGMFDAVTDEVYHGTVDTYGKNYQDGLERIRSTVTQAGNLNPNCNALCVRVQTQDKHGICHHLANADRFIWVK